jgi:nitroreductase
MLIDLVRKNRSYRRFDSRVTITGEELAHLVEMARLCPSSRNQQALKFLAVNQADLCAKLFPNLAWAGYLKDWDGPVEGERPAAYIIIMGDTRLGSKFDIDLGICAQTMLIGAAEKGLGGCMIGSIRREEVRSLFHVPEYLEILLVLALGRPVEHVVIEEIKDDNIRYWRDNEQVHHVPKRKLSDILFYPDVL